MDKEQKAKDLLDSLTGGLPKSNPVADLEPEVEQVQDLPSMLSNEKLFSEVYGFHPREGIPGCPDFPVVMGELEPEDYTYVYKQKDLVTACLSMFSRHSILATGPTGCGKTELFNYIGARQGLKVTRIQCDPLMEKQEIIGQTGLRETDGGNVETVFQPGILAQSITAPGILLVDESDRMPNDCRLAFQSIMESNTRKLTIPQENVSIDMHRDCFVALTGNTKGVGDDIDKYTSAQILDQSTINRVDVHLTMDYLAESAEAKLVMQWEPSIKESLATNLVQFAGRCRVAWNKDELSIPFSPRTLKNVAKYTVLFGSPSPAIEMVYGNALPNVERKALSTYFRIVFGKRYGELA